MKRVGAVALFCLAFYCHARSCGQNLESALDPAQVRRVVSAIRKTFPLLLDDPQLLKPDWRELNQITKVRSTGFCAAAANAAYHMLGGKRAGLVPVVARFHDAAIEARLPHLKGALSHWWLRDRAGRIIDPTADQFTKLGKTPPYKDGKGCGFQLPARQPSKAALKIMKLATKFLRESGFQRNGLPRISRP
jgi:hypothetical protein